MNDDMRAEGLQPTPKDERDFELGAITDLPPLSELPPSFMLEGVRIKDQGHTDFCTAFMSCGMSELQEGVELSPEWSFAVSKQISGKPEDYGVDLRIALSAHTKFGAVEAKDCPYNMSTNDATFLRYIKNYPNLFGKAIPHYKKSYIKVTGEYDHFSNICATIWKYRLEKRAVGSGFKFGWNSRDDILDEIPTGGGGHAMYYAGWKTIKGVPYLIVVNSYGKKAGDGGVHYVSREVVNHFVDMYGAYMFMDMTPGDIKYMIDNGITDRDGFLIQLMKRAVTLLQALLVLKKKA